jgi:hypothetical protein
MFSVRHLIAATALAAAPAVAIAGDADHWIADFDKAAQTAKDAKKDLLVDFTGSDW